MMEVTKVWWDGEKLMAEPVDPAAVYKDSLGGLLDEAKLLADDRPVEVGNLPQWSLDAEHMIRRLVKAVNAAPQPAQQEPVEWGVDWGRAGDIPCVSIIKRLPDGGIQVIAVEYAPYTFKEKP